MDLNDIVKPQEEALKKGAILFSDDSSMKKMLYPKEKNFYAKDFFPMLNNIGNFIKLMQSIKKTTKLIENGTYYDKKLLTKNDYSEFQKLIKSLKIDSYGWLYLKPGDILKDKGVPYKNAIIITMAMNKEIFKSVPSLDGQIEVMEIYIKTGQAVNKITEFLRTKGYNAAPNHSMGGAIDYCKAGLNAGLGYIGRHGMLMTPENGACHRSAIVYSDIENLSDFFPPVHDHSWIKNFCATCGKCIKKCPTKAILETTIIDKYKNVTSIDYDKCCVGFKEYGCGVCIKECPFTTIGYDKIYKSYMNRKNKPL